MMASDDSPQEKPKETVATDERAPLPSRMRELDEQNTALFQQVAHLEEQLEQARQQKEELLQQQKQTEDDVQQVIHDILIRVQGLVAHNEILITTLPGLTAEDLRGRLYYLLWSTMEFNSVIGTMLGRSYLGEIIRWRSDSPFRLLDTARQAFLALASKRGIEIELHNTTGLAQIDMSPVHLQLAFNNLVHNAVKYSFSTVQTAPRERTVRIHTLLEGTSYVITIENYGVGIAPDEIASGTIYQRGYRGRLTQSEARTGAGRGLPYVKEVVEKHNGTIEITSTLMADPHAGAEGQPHLTRVTITLPFTQLRPPRSEPRGDQP